MCAFDGLTEFNEDSMVFDKDFCKFDKKYFDEFRRLVFRWFSITIRLILMHTNFDAFDKDLSRIFDYFDCHFKHFVTILTCFDALWHLFDKDLKRISNYFDDPFKHIDTNSTVSMIIETSRFDFKCCSPPSRTKLRVATAKSKRASLRRIQHSINPR
ncbi:hypothetical protein PanWU01x14_369800 [Parasponia andersonii]|uniref:Uncharacterized protein n=1 Tax=Parasponia andersonii TaxID=3476 RepID=A0A2P5A4H5_PARAD|nr:hypothetical protein PanWU01x14_369800 [Parasponia andersonii]